MKTMLCVVSLVASLSWARACDTRWDCSAACLYETAASACLTPVVYQAMVVYWGPVVYYGPVYYVSPPAGLDCLPWECEWSCRPVSTVIAFGAGGVYSYSNYGQCPWESTVVLIGSRYARPR
jgi:hypothetical protein